MSTPVGEVIKSVLFIVLTLASRTVLGIQWKPNKYRFTDRLAAHGGWLSSYPHSGAVPFAKMERSKCDHFFRFQK